MPPLASPALERWMRDARAALATLEPELAELYEPHICLAHYLDVARYVEGRLRDRTLAQAAFLHGVPAARLRGHLPPELVEPSVLAILEEREKLRALNRTVAESHLGDVLRSVRLPGAAVLFVLEQLHHADPSGQLNKWSLRFHLAPLKCQELSRPCGPAFFHRTDLSTFPSFLRNVVAPTARFFGLWRERNVAEDAALWFSDGERAQLLWDFAIRQSRGDSELQQLTNLVADALGDLTTAKLVTRVRWEWRHLGSLDRRLPRDEPGSGWQSTSPPWRRLLHRTGFVTVVCADAEACYRALHRLHQRHRYRPTEIQDHLGAPSLAGYQALHTMLVPPGERQASAEAIAVRILPGPGELQRARRLNQARLVKVQERFETAGGLAQLAFTPDGRGVELPVGATVLEFAYKLNHRWTARLKGATVNRLPAGVLDRLGPGDVVWLDLANQLTPLPPGWEQKVDSRHVRGIKKQLRLEYKPLLVAEGRRWIRESLETLGATSVPDDATLEPLIDDAQRDVPSFRSWPSAFLLRQLGLFALRRDGIHLPIQEQLDVHLAEKLIRGIHERLQRQRFVTINELNLPPELDGKLTRVVPCDQCAPSVHDRWIGTTVESGVLRLHRPGAACSAGGIPVSRSSLLNRPQYVLIESEDRPGAAADLFRVFQQQEVNVLELAGGSVAAGRGVVRVLIPRLGQDRREALRRGLEAIPGTKKIYGLESEAPPAFLESLLPARRSSSVLSSAHAPPYVCGSDITDDGYFYGMQEEKSELFRAFEEARRLSAPGGRTVWVHGPKRVGKTSLVLNFLSELARTSQRPSITLRFEAIPGLGWAETEQALVRNLGAAVGAACEQHGVTPPAPEGQSLASLARFVRERLAGTLVVALDEVVGLFDECARRGEVDPLLRLRAEIQNQPGWLMLWIGPEAPVSRLPERLQHLLLSRTEPVRVHHLRPQEVGALLRAEKLAPRYWIEVPDHVAKAVFRVTRGNPYWTSMLGAEMWKLAPRLPSGAVRYTQEHLRLARNHLIEQRVPFVDRISEEGSANPRLLSQILIQLATLGRDRAGGLRGLEEKHLLRVLRMKFPGLSSVSLAAELERLVAQGAVVLRMRGKARWWKISAPILADYIVHHYAR
ncbi:MAG TPA: TGS domain-containing protein [Thermoanaerobaculia bacterium]|nr:TGS domain-containing protein [Thermoanaerobaculia bacterium]